MNRNRTIRSSRAKVLTSALLASTMLGGATAALAQAKNDTSTQVGEIIVTATKRSENLQKVAASITALDTKKLDQLNVTEFQDYVKYLPSVSFVTDGPGQTSVYFRGIADGEDGNHSGPLPSVGTYLDEQPITTIGGTLDVHVYDIARVEALAGPQGTLYGASSEAGTIRIITNKPNPTAFSAGVDMQGNNVAHGNDGYVAEGFVNIPLASNIAVRIVGFDEHDAGYINNIYGTRTFDTAASYGIPGSTINNAALVKKAFNTSDTYGGRAALKIDLDNNWSITPTVIAQDQRNNGVFGYEPNVGYLEVQRFQPDSDHDRWIQAALTVQGKLSKMDVTYSGGYFVRQINSRTDYTDYSVAYDGVYGSGAFWTDNSGTGTPLAHPQQEIVGTDKFTKESHELRIASPASDRFRIIAGLFYQRQTHWIIQDYQIQGFGEDSSGNQLAVPGWANTIWLTDQMRVDRDKAIFGEFAYDLTDHITVTGGVRFYQYDNSLKGFFGFSENYDALTGYSSGMGATGQNCLSASHYRGDPCVNLDKDTQGSGETHKFNFTYKFDPQRLVYFTYSTGYRPGGINRNGNFGAYGSDFLSNLEVGWKTTWWNHKIRFNGAIFHEDWDNVQFSFLGPNSLTIIQNAGQAISKGVETDLSWQVTRDFSLSAAGTYTDAKLTTPYCENQTITCTNAVADAPSGTQMPVTPKFKANGIARYGWDMYGWRSHFQAAVVYQDKSYAGLRTADNFGTSISSGVASTGLGVLPSFTTVDISLGGERRDLSLELFVKNLFDEHAQLTRSTPCTISICTATASAYTGATVGAGLAPSAVYAIPLQPRTIGLKLSKKF